MSLSRTNLARAEKCLRLGVLLWAAFAVAGCPVLHAQNDRSRLDTELPNYPVDAAACAKLRKGGKGGVTVDPYKLSGIAPSPGLEIRAMVVPRSPIFLFYAEQQKSFYIYPPALNAAMNCVGLAAMGKNNVLEFDNMPDGRYLMFIYVSRLEEYHDSVLTTGSGYTAFGVPVTTTTSTPESGVARHTKVLGLSFEEEGGKFKRSSDVTELIDW